MRITFTDGTQKGLKEENITRKTLKSPVAEVVMVDGSIFLFPLCNIREIKLDADAAQNPKEAPGKE